MASLSGRFIQFSQDDQGSETDLFVEAGENGVQVPQEQQEERVDRRRDCHCEKKLEQILQRLDTLSRQMLQLQEKLCLDDLKEVRGSKIEVPLTEKAARMFILDPFFAQKNDKLTWVKSLLIKCNIDSRHTEMCRKYLLRKCADWRNNIRIKMLSSDHQVDGMPLADLKGHIFGGMRFLNGLVHTEPCTHLLLILRWFVYDHHLFGQVAGRKSLTTSSVGDFWAEIKTFWEAKEEVLNGQEGWLKLADRDTARAEKARKINEAKNAASQREN